MKKAFPQTITLSGEQRAALRERQRELIGDGLEFLDLHLPEHGAAKAKAKHSARTARYKKEQILNGAPDSEAVRLAASNVLLTMVRDSEEAAILRTLTTRELSKAGYNDEQGEIVFQRLLDDLDDLRVAWHRRSRQKMALLINEILAETPVNHDASHRLSAPGEME